MNRVIFPKVKNYSEFLTHAQARFLTKYFLQYPERSLQLRQLSPAEKTILKRLVQYGFVEVVPGFVQEYRLVMQTLNIPAQGLKQ
jgi:hypothetical protein